MSQGKGKTAIKEILKRYYNVFLRFKFLSISALLAVTFANIAYIVIPVYFRRFFDLMTGAPNPSIVPVIMQLLLLIILLRLAGWLMYRIYGFCTVRFESIALAELRIEAFTYLVNHSHRFFANSFSGSLTQKVNKYAKSLQTIFDSLGDQIIPTIVAIFGSLIVIYRFNFKIGLIFSIGIFFFITVNIIFFRYKRKYDYAASEADTHTTAVLADAISNQQTIHLFSGNQFEIENIKATAYDLKEKKITQWNIAEWAFAVYGFSLVVVEYFILRYSILAWSNGLITVGTIIMFQVYMIGLISRLFDFSHVLRRIYEAFSDAGEIVGILNQKHEIEDVPNAKELAVTKGEIKFEEIRFGYYSENYSFNKLSVTIPSKQKVALVGPSGAGKTTFIKLLLRFFDPIAGKILIDDQDIREVTQDSLHDQIAVVSQEPILFHRTLMENIRYGRRNATDAEVYEAARKANCHDFIEKMPNKYNTLVGERGIKLSGGERQRVAIARAILKNAPILILDEATSSLDSHSELLIQDALRLLMEDKTVLVIAHRLSTIQKMDRILVLDNGEIIEDGTHQDLLSENSKMYRKLWELQAGGFIKNEQ